MDVVSDETVSPPWSVLEFTFSSQDTDTEFVVMCNYRQFIISASADSFSKSAALRNKYLFFLKVADNYELDGYTLEDFYDWIVEPLLPEFRELPEITSTLTLHHFLFPKTHKYDIREDEDQLVAVPSNDSNFALRGKKDTSTELRERWAQQVSDTVRQLHAAGIVWGDAKPDNVLVDQENNAWLIDFGGGYTNGWVSKELSGTVEGDLEGLKKMNDQSEPHKLRSNYNTMPAVERGWITFFVDRVFGWWSGLPGEISSYTTEFTQIPIHDVKLAANLYRPTTSPLGTILIRTSYGIAPLMALGNARMFASRGYQVLLAACRGTDPSDGQDIVPAVHEAQDGLATVSWMREQPWYTGSFATCGGSYLGHTQWAILTDPPPDTKAAVISTGPVDFGAFTWGTYCVKALIQSICLLY
ncbi:cocaine esterase [Fusarium bulbicola]|nr:cocaine esterase [Fusarium bulbicola]